MMFELFLLAIQGTTVTMMGHAFEPDVVVPTHIVRYCGKLNDVEKISKNFLNLKKKKKYTKNINEFLQKTKKDFERFFNIKIEYLENRHTNDLSLSNKYNGSKIFLAYYYKEVRLIDNF